MLWFAIKEVWKHFQVATTRLKDCVVASGRSEVVYSKPCRHEKSPSKSNEVISPEILKMRAALFCIFTYLDTKTLLKTAEVCRNWRFVARHPAVWTRVLLENARISSKVHCQLFFFIALFLFLFSKDLCNYIKYLFLFVVLVFDHIVSVVHSDTLPHSPKP